jgi:hypothetical protein
MIYKHRFPASQILRVGIAQDGKLSVPFLNWRISPRPLRERNADRFSFIGCGLYGVCFRGWLVYVGSYCGKKPKGIKQGAYFAGDIANSRWWQHFGSLTARSHKLHVAPSVLLKLRSDIREHQMLLALTQAGEALHTDDGCLGAENRLRFAARNWTRFSSATAPVLLRQFSFLYARISGEVTHGSSLDIERAIAAAESAAISLMQPEVNTAQRDRSVIGRRLSPRRALDQLAQILDEHLALCDAAA